MTENLVPCHIKKVSPKGLTANSKSIPLLFDYSLRLAPSVTGVAVASSTLCISTTLNKRKPCLYKVVTVHILACSEKSVNTSRTG